MASDLDIAKLALFYVGDRFDLTSLSDATTEAEAVNRVYDHMIRMLMEAHPWQFAKRWAEPSALDVTEPANWTYAFAYPDDALRIWKIKNPLGDDEPPIPFEVGTLSTGRKVILTDEEDPEFEYSTKDYVASDFPPHVVEAAARRIAAAITMALTGDRALRRDNLTLAERATAQAKVLDANEDVKAESNRDPDWLRARG